VPDRPTQPELLSPAGDWDSLRAAVANGANAVYFGLSNFNARHRATNFTLEELPEVMKYLHERNVRGYVAFNTLIFSDELPEAVKFITAAANAKIDALIVQDLGLAHLIHILCPTLPIHGSTQMTLTESRGINFVHTLGVQRVILARELSTTDIKLISTKTDVPLEVFIHGALCVAYSGQCLTSESLGGRSANRGQCAQACRLPYDLVVDGQIKDLGDKAYLLSPQDLAAHDLVDDLLKIGVCSLKIEGRLKSAHYVAAATQTYRAALDASLANLKFQISTSQSRNLAQSFSRGFTHGFLDGPDHQKLVHARFPKSRGIRIGTVISKSPNGVVVNVGAASAAVPPTLKPNDGIAFDEGHPEQDEQGGRIQTVIPIANRKSQIANLELTFQDGNINLSAIAIGSIVWKTDDPSVRRDLEHSFSRDTIPNRIPLTITVRAIEDHPLTLHIIDPDNHQLTISSEQPMQRAQKHPLTEQLFRDQFGRLGNTPFTLATIKITGPTDSDPPHPIMTPKSVLNDLRRRAVDQLLSLRANSHPITNPQALDHLRSQISNHKSEIPHSDLRKPASSASSAFNSALPSSPIENRKSKIENSLCILTRTLDQLRSVLDWTSPGGIRPSIVYCDFEDIRRYKEAVQLARQSNLPIALATLRIIKPTEEGLLQQIADNHPHAILIRNLAALSFYKEHTPEMTLFGDYSLNASNELTAHLLLQSGLTRLVPSYDLNWQQLRALLTRIDPQFFEVVIHQHMPMFHMEHCVFAHTLSNGKDYRTCGRPCDHHQLDLRDRVGQSHPLIPDVGCRNTVFNASAQSAAEYIPRMKELGLQHFRLELLRENAEETHSLLDRYSRILAGQDSPQSTLRQLRVLNQLGVTRGTLDFT
jgi:putative protease